MTKHEALYPGSVIPALKQLDLKQELASITGDEYKFARA